MKPLPILVLAAFAVGASGAAGWIPQQDPEFVTEHAGGSVHMLTGQGGNIGLCVGDDGILMIDSQFPHTVDGVRAQIEGLGEHPLRYLVNTHWHGDHVGGNAAFGADATIVAHDRVRERMAEGSPPDREASPEVALPDLTFNDRLTFWFNGERIEAWHLPQGHTDGDAVIYFPDSRVVHMGDHLFNGLFPYVDLGSGGDVRGYLRNLETMLERLPDGVKVIPGHGPLGDKEAIRASAEMIRDTLEIVGERIAEGMDEDACAEAGLPPEYESWSWQFIDTARWLRICHRSLSAE